MSHANRPDHDLPQRVQRLEEAQGFTEHASDQMLDHLRALDRGVRELARRLDALEHRMNLIPPPKPETECGGSDSREQ